MDNFKINDSNIYKILDCVNCSIYWKDNDGVYLGCNRYMLNMLQLQSRQEVIGKTDFDLMWSNYANQLKEHDKIAIRDGNYSIEESFIDKNGQKRVYLTNKNRLIDSRGNIHGIIGTSIEITAEKKVTLLKIENEKYQIRAQEHKKIATFLDSMFRHQQAEIRKFINLDIGRNEDIELEDISLSPRESQILFLLYNKFSIKGIAEYISQKINRQISHETVNSIVNKHLYIKFGAYSIDKLIEKAILLKMIPLIFPDSEK